MSGAAPPAAPVAWSGAAPPTWGGVGPVTSPTGATWTIEPAARSPWRAVLIAMTALVIIGGLIGVTAWAVGRSEPDETSIGERRMPADLGSPGSVVVPGRDIADFIDRPWERITLPGGGGTIEFPTGSTLESLPTSAATGESVTIPVRFVGTGSLMSSDQGVLAGQFLSNNQFVFDVRAGAEGMVSGAGATMSDYRVEASPYGDAASFRATAPGRGTAMIGYVVANSRTALFFMVLVPADQTDVGELTLQRLVTSLDID